MKLISSPSVGGTARIGCDACSAFDLHRAPVLDVQRLRSRSAKRNAIEREELASPVERLCTADCSQPSHGNDMVRLDKLLFG